jgi:hypothetical protein
MGKLSKSSVHLAGFEVENIVPKKNTGPKEPTTIAVILSQNL